MISSNRNAQIFLTHKGKCTWGQFQRIEAGVDAETLEEAAEILTKYGAGGQLGQAGFALIWARDMDMKDWDFATFYRKCSRNPSHDQMLLDAITAYERLGNTVEEFGELLGLAKSTPRNREEREAVNNAKHQIRKMPWGIEILYTECNEGRHAAAAN